MVARQKWRPIGPDLFVLGAARVGTVREPPLFPNRPAVGVRALTYAHRQVRYRVELAATGGPQNLKLVA